MNRIGEYINYHKHVKKSKECFLTYCTSAGFWPHKFHVLYLLYEPLTFLSPPDLWNS